MINLSKVTATKPHTEKESGEQNKFLLLIRKLFPIHRMKKKGLIHDSQRKFLSVSVYEIVLSAVSLLPFVMEILWRRE